MKNLETESAVAEAIRFLLARIAEESCHDPVPLSEVELRQLSFSEGTASADELAAVAKFDAANDGVRFEAKITKLVLRAYRNDIQRGMKSIWREHLAALRNEDIYVLVIVDQARISRPSSDFLASFVKSLTPHKETWTLRSAALALVMLSGIVYFFLLPMKLGLNSPRIFGYLAEKLIPSEGVRGVFFVVWMASVFLLVRKTKSARIS
jgi:RNase P protein component